MATADPGTRAPLNAESLFDTIGPRYESAFAVCTPQQDSIAWLLKHLPAHASVLDIGCGTGRPVCSALASAGHSVIGIDVSSAMIDTATVNVPQATFKKIDIKDFNPPEGKQYDAITVYFSLIASVTQQQIKDAIANIHKWLKPGGFFIFATVPFSGDNVEIKWMGLPTVVSGFSGDEIVKEVEAVGFEVLKTMNSKFLPSAVDAGICGPEDVWEEEHIFVYAKKSSN